MFSFIPKIVKFFSIAPGRVLFWDEVGISVAGANRLQTVRLFQSARSQPVNHGEKLT